MPKVSVSADIPAAPEQVWALAIDLSRVPEWNSMHEAFIADVPDTLAEGSTYKQRVKLMGMPAEMAWRVTAAQEPGRLEQAADGPMGVKAEHRFIIEPTDEGSKVTIEMEFNGPALNGPMKMMVEKQAGSATRDSMKKFAALLA
jgi:Polyketide cyclase / dehydrase and lipid transport